MFKSWNKKQVAAGVVLFYILLLAAFIYFQGPKIQRLALLTIESKQIDADINSINLQHIKKGPDLYEVNYSFMVDGKQFAGEDDINTGDLDDQQTIEIKYHPSNPAVNLAYDSTTNLVAMPLLIMMMVFGFMLTAVAFLRAFYPKVLEGRETFVRWSLWVLTGLIIIFYLSTSIYSLMA